KLVHLDLVCVRGRSRSRGGIDLDAGQVRGDVAIRYRTIAERTAFAPLPRTDDVERSHATRRHRQTGDVLREYAAEGLAIVRTQRAVGDEVPRFLTHPPLFKS